MAAVIQNAIFNSIKNISQKYVFILLSLLSTSALAVPATYFVNDQQSFEEALTLSFANRDERDTIFIVGTVDLTSTISIQSRVTIEGFGSNREDKIRSFDFSNLDRPVLNIQYPGVIVRNLTLEGTGSNVADQLFSTSRPDGAVNTTNRALINLAAISRSSNPSDFRLTNVNLMGSAVGVSSVGIMPRNLTITNSRFTDVNRGIELLRDVERASADIGNKLDGGFIVISDNEFLGNNMRFAIGLDAGNDGFPGVAPGFPNPQSETRRRFRDRPTFYDMSQSRINRNFIDSAREFGIALATVSNLFVVGNDITIRDNGGEYSSAINVEHNSDNIVVQLNTLNVETTGDTYAFTLSPFNDHGALFDFAQVSSNITYSLNKVNGTGRAAFFAAGYKNLTLVENDLSNFTSTMPFGINSAFYNVPGGFSNSFVQDNFNLFITNFEFSGTGPRAPQSFFYDQNGNLQIRNEP